MAFRAMRGVLGGVAMAAVMLGCHGGTSVRQRPSEEGRPTPSAAPALPEIAAAHEVFLQEPPEQALYLRRWAKDADSERGRLALRVLAWRRDEQAGGLAAAALKSARAKTRLLAAQVLAHLGAAGPEAVDALKTTDMTADRSHAPGPAIVWARVVLGDRSVLPAALAALADGSLASVTRLGGGAAFFGGGLARVMTPEEARARLSDASPVARMAAAWVLGEGATKADAPELAKLLSDPEQAVLLAATGALARIDAERARQAIRDALAAAAADKARRARLLEELARSGGGPALVAALGAPADESEAAAWFQTQEVFRWLERVADPRGALPLGEWAATAPHAHWKGVAGIAIAELGDLRAAPLLAARMKLAPEQLYEREKFWQADEGGHLSRTDRSRIVAARLLAELPVLHPSRKDALAKVARGPVTAWLDQQPSPHANGMRLLARLGGAEDVARLRRWAFPSEPLPAEGAQPPFPRAYETAQSALRYVGATRDAASFDALLAQLERKTDPALDITQEGLMGAGNAMLGMALRAVAYGAASGLAEWGTPIDARAFAELSAFVEDETWHEEARLAACAAIPRIASDGELETVVGRIRALGKSPDRKKRFVAQCYATGLGDHAPPALAGSLITLLRLGYDDALRLEVARAIGVAGLGAAGAADKHALQEALERRETRAAAAVAWLLGGSPHEARRTIAYFGEPGWAATLEPVKEAWYRSLGHWSATDDALSNVHRWVTNAEAIGEVELAGAPQRWALSRLMSQLENVVFDNGPRSLTRVVLQHRLVAQAKAKNVSAVRVLGALRAQGALMALAGESGDVGDAARRTLHEVQNPPPEP